MSGEYLFVDTSTEDFLVEFQNMESNIPIIYNRSNFSRKFIIRRRFFAESTSIGQTLLDEKKKLNFLENSNIFFQIPNFFENIEFVFLFEKQNSSISTKKAHTQIQIRTKFF